MGGGGREEEDEEGEGEIAGILAGSRTGSGETVRAKGGRETGQGVGGALAKMRRREWPDSPLVTPDRPRTGHTLRPKPGNVAT